MKSGARAVVLFLSAAAPALAEPPPVTLPPIEQFSAMLDHPLFSATRRPAAEPTVALAATNLASSSLHLVGLVKTAEGRTVALIRDSAAKTETRLRAGSQVNGWTLGAIDGRGVELSGGGQRLRLKINDAIPMPP